MVETVVLLIIIILGLVVFTYANGSSTVFHRPTFRDDGYSNPVAFDRNIVTLFIRQEADNGVEF